jgi:hypothetical protein
VLNTNLKELAMPRINFSKVDDAKSLPPAGLYVCAVASVKEGETRDGDEMWRVRYKVIKGEQAGKVFFDNLVFSEAAMPRVKLACKALGIDTTAEVELNSEDILGLICSVRLEPSEYVDKRGKTKQTVSVPFDGYGPAGGEGGGAI